MAKKTKRPTRNRVIIEQIALMITSFIWTAVALSVIVLFWFSEDLEANWGILFSPTSSHPAEVAFASEVAATATPTPWMGSPPTTTPTETLIPTPTSTWVIPPPGLLPETLNPDDPTPIPVTPIPVIVHTQEEVGDYVPTPVTVERVQPSPTATATPQQVAQQTQPQQNTAQQSAPAAPPPPPPTATTAPQVVQAASASVNPDRLVIPAVRIDSPVIPVGWRLVEQNGQQYSIWDVADYAVGWHNSSASLGQPGNTVMAGHHNINGEVFRDLVNVEVGDEVILYRGNETRRYLVEVKTIVKEKGEPTEVRRKNAQWIAPTNDERITMVTCWPYTNNTHRVIVVAKPTG